jgi:hypothetical protein
MRPLASEHRERANSAAVDALLCQGAPAAVFLNNVYRKMRDDEFPARLKREFIVGGVAIAAVLLAAFVLHLFL